MAFHRRSKAVTCLRYDSTLAGDQSGTQPAGRSSRGMSSVETGISAARQSQKSRARSSRASAQAADGTRIASSRTHTKRGVFMDELSLSPDLRRRLGGAQRVVERLAVAHRLSDHAPAVVVAAEPNR